MLRGVAIAGAIATVMGWMLGAGTALAGVGGCARAASIADSSTRRAAADSVLCLVNRERAKRGLRRLRASRQLTRSAQSHSRDMVRRRYFSHVSPGGMSANQRVRRSGYMRKRRGCRIGETIAWGTGSFATPAALVRTFMRSSGHRRILLDRRYRDIGIGLSLGAPEADAADYGDGATLTLNFGAR